MCAVQLRMALVGRIHSLYFRGTTAHRLLHGSVTTKLIDNPDNRVTRDVDMLTTSIANLIAETFTAPFAIIYCE